ncbi:MAG: polyprenyl synthetase family protein [Oscillospiraceae bacterium]|nr:polyprenyl synthetase family protein [Oscillospiraceae bacterium]
MENSFVQYIKENIDLINAEMQDILKMYNLLIQEQTDNKDKCFNAFVEASDGGKRIRAVLVKLGYEIFGGQDVQNIVTPAVVFEIIQTGLLIHDDIIDKSLTRRNKPAVQIALGGDHHAMSNAICLGDFAFLISNLVIIKSNFNEEYKTRALEIFNNAIFNTIIGQLQDIDFEKNKPQTEEEILRMNINKTAYYTIIGPLQVGASLAGVKNERLLVLEKFGKLAGIMFQIQDDILGIFGDEKTIGKPITSDIKEGKSTILSMHTLKKLNENQKKEFKKIYGNNENVTIKNVESIKNFMIETGALDYAKEKMEDYYSQSKSIIPEITKSEEKIKLLEDFLNYLIKREK